MYRILSSEKISTTATLASARFAVDAEMLAEASKPAPDQMNTRGIRSKFVTDKQQARGRVH
jgi:hypothetical protein